MAGGHRAPPLAARRAAFVDRGTQRVVAIDRVGAVAVLCEAGLIVATTIGQWRFVARDETAIDAFIASIVSEL